MMRSNTLLNNVRRGNVEMGTVQQQLSTGDRLLAPSSDPAAANSALSLQRILEQQGQLLDNIRNASTIFNTTDGRLGEAADLLREVQTTAQGNLDTLTTPEQKQAAAQIISAKMDQLLTLANYSQAGVYIFGGTANTSVPFISEPDGIRYVGADQGTRALLGAQFPTPVGLTGEEVFGALSSEMRGYKDLTPQMVGDTRLADLRGADGVGVMLSSFTIDDGASTINVNLAGCDRVSDVIDRINTASLAGGAQITAALGPANNLRISSSAVGADLTVSEIGGGRAAHDLGIAQTAGGASFDGGNVRPLLTATTDLTQLAGGAWIDLVSGIVITNGSKTAGLQFTGDKNVGDMLDRINGAGVGVLARINDAGTGIDIVNTLSGSEMRIGENGGWTADQLGVRSMNSQTTVSSLNDGIGVRTAEGGASDFVITARNGSQFHVSVAGATTLSGVIAKINADAAAAGINVQAALASRDNGIELTDSTGGMGNLQVSAENASSAASDLGLVQSVAGNTLTGTDVNGVQPSGMFAHLAQLRDALLKGDTAKITSTAERLQEDYQRVVNLRAKVGGVVQDLEGRQARNEDQTTANKALLSELKDVDFTEAATRFQMLETTLQGSMLAGAKMLNLSLLDFLG